RYATKSHAEYNMGLLDCTTELVLLILECLGKGDIKQVRLVCKALKTLTVGMLFDRLYVSSHEKDMLVFDAVTQRPDLRKSVKAIHFDTARFMMNPTVELYVSALSKQLASDEYSHLRGADHSIQKMMGRMNGKEQDHQADTYYIYGFRDYHFMAREVSNLLSPSWFARVLRGLKLLGPIDEVHFVNTFNTEWIPEIMHPEEFLKEEQESGDDKLEATRPSIYSYEAGIFEEIWCGSDTEMQKDWEGWTKTVTDGLQRCNATLPRLPVVEFVHLKRPTGSPSARTWPLFNLQPMEPTLDPREDTTPNTSTDRLLGTSSTDGSVELFRAVELLHLANKTPKIFAADIYRWDDDMFSFGLPTHPFATKPRSNDIQVTDIWSKLTVLKLEFASYTDGSPVQEPQLLHQLKNFLQRSTTLQVLKLTLPDDELTYYRYEDVFPPATQWRIRSLEGLHLECLSISYYDLVGLLFASFPSVHNLILGRIRLMDGDWGSIMEGLWTRHKIRDACLAGLDYTSGQNYYFGDNDDPSSDEMMHFARMLSEYISQLDHRKEHDDLFKSDPYLSTTRFETT
ncbi:MAG: hypothetical protein Q9169_007627, partial [Polycauliona sp. 2 TL-2023]